MIKLKNKENTVELQLDIVGYQFPKTQDNWCLLQVCVQQGDQHFQKTEPALQTTDLKDLYNWFDALANARLPSYACMDFIEPCLSLAYVSYIKQAITIAITLECEIKPNFPRKHPHGHDDNWTLEFELHEQDLIQIRQNIQQWIQNYPSREKN